MPAIYRFIFVICLLVLAAVIRQTEGFAVITALAIGGIAFGVYNLGSHAKVQFTRDNELMRFQDELFKVTHSIDKELDMEKLDAAAKLEIEAQLAILVQIYTHCSNDENDADLLPVVIDKFNKVLSKYEKFSDVHGGLEELTLEDISAATGNGIKTTWDKTMLLMAMRTLASFVHQTARILRSAMKNARGDAAVVAAILKVVQAFKERGAQISSIYTLRDTVDDQESVKTVGRFGMAVSSVANTIMVFFDPTGLSALEAGITLASAVANEGRESQVSTDWRLWWCPMIKAEWANEQHLKLSREAKEATETLRKQIFTQQLVEDDEIVVSEFHSDNDKEVMPNIKGGGTSHCFEE